MNAWDYITQFFSWIRTEFLDATATWPTWAQTVLYSIIGIVLIIAVALILVMVFIWLERRLIGRFQIRPGPNRAGPFGLLQPVADTIKVLSKEDVVPARGDKWVHLLAPIVVFMPALMLFAVVPIQDGAVFADLNIGILYFIAIGTLGVIGIFMAGWASNNKYSLLAGMRAVAQMISYEIPMVLSIIGVLLIVGSLQMGTIVTEQAIPFILLQPLGFLIYFIGASAELNRSPMDLLEADSEIVAGYNIEYSGIKFALLFLAEYTNALAISAITTTLFLGGWKQPFSQELFILPPWLWFVIKVFAVFCLLLWIRSTLPRLRVDQLMGFAWKFLLPLALINIFITSIEVLYWPESVSYWVLVPINIVVAGGLIFFWSRAFFKFGGGRVEV